MIILTWIAIVVVFISSIVRRVGRRGNKNNNRYVCYFCNGFYSCLISRLLRLVFICRLRLYRSSTSFSLYRSSTSFSLYAPIWSETPVAFIPLVVSNLISEAVKQTFPLDVVYPYPLHVVLASLLYMKPIICSSIGPD